MAAYEKHKLKKSISTIFLLLFHVCKYILKGRLTGLTNRKHLAGTNTIPLHRYCGLHTSETGQRLARVVSCLLRNLTWKKITVPISKFPKATKKYLHYQKPWSLLKFISCQEKKFWNSKDGVKTNWIQT
jgi:hypothetical protein